MNRNRQHFLIDFAPDGGEEILIYSDADMAEIFTEEQRQLIAEGQMVYHHWPRGHSNHIIMDMVVTARKKRNS